MYDSFAGGERAGDAAHGEIVGADTESTHEFVRRENLVGTAGSAHPAAVEQLIEALEN